MGVTTYAIPGGGEVKITGAMAHADFPKEMSVFVEGVLQTVGDICASKMRGYTDDFDFTGTLTKSIAWRTATRNSAVDNNKYLIAAPTTVNRVDIGSAAPYAWYREYGAGRHRNADGSAEFIASMRKWVAEKLGINTSAGASKAEQREFWNIVNSIRYGAKASSKVQNKQPFVAPVEAQLPGIAIKVATDALTAFWIKMAKKYPS
jgi:hypothetical protein